MMDEEEEEEEEHYESIRHQHSRRGGSQTQTVT